MHRALVLVQQRSKQKDVKRGGGGAKMTTERGCCFRNEQFGQGVKRTVLVGPQQKSSDYGMDVTCM